ncbi:synaptotagmin-13 [Discoglossus pictus]
MFPVPVIALGATLGTATGLFALCGLVCFCKYLHCKKMPPEYQGDTPVTMTNVLHPGLMNIYKCTEPIQPQAMPLVPHIYCSKQTSLEILNYKDYTLKNEEKETARAQEEKNIDTSPRENKTDNTEHCLTPDKDDLEKFPNWNLVPKLRYSLGYERQKEELCVSFLEAVSSSVSTEDDSCSHCYVLGTLATGRGQTEAQTALLRRAQHTVWEEALLFPLQEEERAGATLTLSLRYCDRFSRQLVAGEITLSLANVGVPFGTTRWVDLRIPEKDPDMTGEVLLSLSFLPAANRLIVVLIKARNIHSNKDNDLLGKDLFMKVILKHQCQRLKKKQTKRAKHKINPVWNEMVMFEVPSEVLGETSVELMMHCQDPNGGPSQVLGTCSLGLEWTGTGKSHWQEMITNPRRQIAMWHHLHP